MDRKNLRVAGRAADERFGAMGALAGGVRAAGLAGDAVMICICDAPTDRPGLCGKCATSPRLLAAFREGVERRSGWDPLVGWLWPMSDGAAGVVGEEAA